jgi:hypothetical protein
MVVLSLKRWIRASCPAQRHLGQKAWFLPETRPPAAAGHIPVPELLCRVASWLGLDHRLMMG